MNRMEKNKKLRDELRQSEQHANRFARKTRNRHEEQVLAETVLQFRIILILIFLLIKES